MAAAMAGYFNACSGCFWLERIAGCGLHPLETAALARFDSVTRPLKALAADRRGFGHRYSAPATWRSRAGGAAQGKPRWSRKVWPS